MIPQCPISFVNNTQQDIINPICFIEEVWKPITGKAVPDVVEGAYLVSNTGKVYSNLRHCLLIPTPTWNGYYRVCLRLNNKTSRYYLIHRIVMITHFCIDEYESMQVNHKDGDKSYNCFTNLEWKSCGENIGHAYMTGLKKQHYGEDCTSSKITNDQAKQIFELSESGTYSINEIADIVGCSNDTVSRVRSSRSWMKIKSETGYIQLEESKPLTDNQVHMICKFFEDNDPEDFGGKVHMFRFIASNILNIPADAKFIDTAYRLYNKTRRLDIVCKYNY